MNKGFTSGCGSQIRTDDLRVMSFPEEIDNYFE